MNGNISSATLRVLANLLRVVSAITKNDLAETSPSHVFKKEINHANTQGKYFNGNFYCKNRM